MQPAKPKNNWLLLVGVIGATIYDLGNRQWDIPGLRLLLETILPKKRSLVYSNSEHWLMIDH
jgi:hypothetical protein